MNKTISHKEDNQVGIKEIFIGSSTEAYHYAQMIASIIGDIKGVKPIIWKDLFKTGDITFLTIEQLVSRISGAIIITSPDDDSVVRDIQVKTPRANVLFEYGYLTSRLTRKRVALCSFSNVYLPSDFGGLTYVVMGDFQDKPDISPSSKYSLISWATDLPALQPGLSATTLLHGYSGPWFSESVFSTWRSMEIKKPDYVIFNGEVVLSIPTDGCKGKVSIYGTLEAKIGDCYASFQRNDRIHDASVNMDGSLIIRSEMLSRQLLKIDGEPPQKDGFEQQLRGTRHFTWKLQKHNAGENCWTGSYETIIADEVVFMANLKFYRY